VRRRHTFTLPLAPLGLKAKDQSIRANPAGNRFHGADARDASVQHVGRWSMTASGQTRPSRDVRDMAGGGEHGFDGVRRLHGRVDLLALA
jgi:hypothetical protein